MRAVVDLVDAIAGTWTRTISILVIGGIAVVAIVTLIVSLTAPAVVENVGDRAERISNNAIEAAREEGRVHALAQEGWGYSDNNSDTANSAADDFSDDGSEPHGDDWGAPSE